MSFPSEYIYPPFAPTTSPVYCTCPFCAYHRSGQGGQTTLVWHSMPYVPKHRKPGPAR